MSPGTGSAAWPRGSRHRQLCSNRLRLKDQVHSAPGEAKSTHTNAPTFWLLACVSKSQIEADNSSRLDGPGNSSENAFGSTPSDLPGAQANRCRTWPVRPQCHTVPPRKAVWKHSRSGFLTYRRFLAMEPNSANCKDARRNNMGGRVDGAAASAAGAGGSSVGGSGGGRDAGADAKARTSRMNAASHAACSR